MLHVTFDRLVGAGAIKEKRLATLVGNDDTLDWLATFGVADHVATVSASRETLEFIKAHFPNLPMRENPQTGWVIWYGDHAKFIAGNLA